jgi:DNA mismatch repair protein MutS2
MVCANTRTERGRAMAQALLPAGPFDRVRREQAATAHVRELVSNAGMSIAPAIETGSLTARAEIGGSLAPEELRSVADAAAAAAAAYGKTREIPSDALGAITAAYRPLTELHHAIVDAIDERGTVLERASPALGQIRRALQNAQNEARDRVGALLRSAKFAKAVQDAVVTIRDGRFVVPIKAEFSGEVPGIVHDTSSSGQTLFVEPLAALDANNRVRTLRLDEEREIARILAELSRRVGASAGRIDANVEMLARLDVFVAKARVGIAMSAVPPELDDEPCILIERGRHPLLGERAIEQSLELTPECRLIVISGPNMGGKTVTLKMVGLFTLMTFAGLQLPAERCRVGAFTRLFTDIGDEQSIAENASTFSAHMGRMRQIVQDGGERSLILVDEIGGGTEPASGAALAIAMIERLLRSRAFGIVTTHSTELKLFAHQTPGIANASVRFDPRTFAPTYQLDVGTPGQSLAFPLARSLGIPSEILDRAQLLLSTRERDYEAALEELSEINAGLQDERRRLELERRRAETLQATLRSRSEALERERRAFVESAERRLQEVLREFSGELARRESRGRPKVTPSQSALLDRTLQALHLDLGIADERTDAVQAQPVRPGDVVRVVSLAQEAVVIADNGESLLVAIGPMKTVVRKDDVRPGPPRAATSRIGGGGEARFEGPARTASELDVRGKRYVEAEPLVDRWIDEAALAGHSPLRLIHGKGTGMLGRGLQEFLRDHPAVKTVRYGDENEGGSGVTVVELR